MIDKFIEWCGDNSTKGRLTRTIVQGILGVVCGWLSAGASNDPMVAVYIAPIVMCIISPVMSMIGAPEKEDEENGL